MRKPREGYCEHGNKLDFDCGGCHTQSHSEGDWRDQIDRDFSPMEKFPPKFRAAFLDLREGIKTRIAGLIAEAEHKASRPHAEGGWEKEFDRLFIEDNVWEGEDEYTKNVAVGNIKDFIASEIASAEARGAAEALRLCKLGAKVNNA